MINIGDRVKVVWNFDNKKHTGVVTHINSHSNKITIHTITHDIIANLHNIEVL